MMKRWMFGGIGFVVGVIAGVFLGADRTPFDFDINIREVELPKQMQNALVNIGHETGPDTGIGIATEDWEVYVVEGDEANVLTAVSTHAGRPILIVEQGQSGMFHRLGYLDALEQMVAAYFSNEGHFSRFVVMPKEAERVAYAADQFGGAFSRKMRLEEPVGMWGNFSEKNWIPLWESPQGLKAKYDDEEWRPVTLKNGTYVFVDKEHQESEVESEEEP